jgi:pimeloyl-ACP methyl ester carboxylesterase
MARIPPPGRLIDIGGFRLHLNCAGQGSPAVVLDAALGASSISWSLVQPALAGVAQVCSYDRAGFGWSDPGPMPRTAGRIAAELRRLLERAGVVPPFVLVGHSYGGLVMRVFASRYWQDTAALVLVDPAHPEDWVKPAPKEQVRIDRGVSLCRHGARAARLGLASAVGLLVSAGALSPARALVRAAMAATSGSSALSTASPSAGSASTSSPLARAIAVRSPNSPTCASPTLSTTPTRGGAIWHR